jgi:hypothetical protein
MIKYYNVWNGFSLVCPDLKDGAQFSLVGDSSEMVSSKYSFNIDKCKEYKTDGPRKLCKSDKEIDAKVNQIQLDTW